jgi:hypothetical protein
MPRLCRKRNPIHSGNAKSRQESASRDSNSKVDVTNSGDASQIRAVFLTWDPHCTRSENQARHLGAKLEYLLREKTSHRIWNFGSLCNLIRSDAFDALAK